MPKSNYRKRSCKDVQAIETRSSRRKVNSSKTYLSNGGDGPKKNKIMKPIRSSKKGKKSIKIINFNLDDYLEEMKKRNNKCKGISTILKLCCRKT